MKLFDKVLSGLGNIKAMERLHVDTFTEGLIENVEGDKIAESEDGEIWAGFQELGGYYFLNLNVISKISLKSKKRNILTFLGSTEKLVLTSDADEFESDYSNVSKRWMTHITYEVSEEEIKTIQKEEATTITLQVKKTLLSFNTIKLKTAK
jgi:hypothetical protein